MHQRRVTPLVFRLLAAIGCIAVALLVLMSNSVLGLRKTVPAALLRYEIRDNHGIVEPSLFGGTLNSKLKPEVVERIVRSARKRAKPTACSAGVKSSLLSSLLSSTTVLAQDPCPWPPGCTGHWMTTCAVTGQNCENLRVCCSGEGFIYGCVGHLWPCDEGGSLCGQDTCISGC